LWENAFDTPDSGLEQQARATLEKIALFAGLNSKINELDFEKDFYPAIMDALFSCNSWIAIVMITDLLARKYRFNVPGIKANLNWTRRIQRSIAQLRSSPRERKRMQLIHELLEKAGRV
jgi:4-alpha-glucanotransferase